MKFPCSSFWRDDVTLVTSSCRRLCPSLSVFVTDKKKDRVRSCYRTRLRKKLRKKERSSRHRSRFAIDPFLLNEFLSCSSLFLSLPLFFFNLSFNSFSHSNLSVFIRTLEELRSNFEERRTDRSIDRSLSSRFQFPS